MEALVNLARNAARAPDVDALRTRLLYNIAAANGPQVESIPIRKALQEDQGPGSTAFHLAVRMHARAQDDFYPAGRVHVGTITIPAVLAIQDAQHLLPALSAGYEVLTAIASAYSDVAQERGYRPSGIFGPIGAAAAAGVALDLDDNQLASALALASTMSAGTNQPFIDGTDEWLIVVASASRAGVDAARLAKAGIRGAKHAFEGVAGWSGAFFGDPGAGRLNHAISENRSRTADVAIKRYPISGIAQVPAYLAGEIGVASGHREPERIEVRLSPRELSYPGSDNRGPFNSRSDALISVARSIAVAYLNHRIPYGLLFDSPETTETRIIEMIELIADEDLEEAEAIVTATVDGSTYTRHGRGQDLLFPDWATTSQTTAEIAQFSEAPAELIERLREALDSDPDPDTIRELLGVVR